MMKKRFFRKGKVEGEVSHQVKVVDQKGRFLLVECLRCRERALAVSKEEASSIYKQLECLA